MSLAATRARDRLQSRGFTHVVRWTIVLALWTLLISMATGRFGVSNYMQLREAAALLTESNMRLSIANQLIEAEIHELRHSQSARRLFVTAQSGRLSHPGSRIVHLGAVPTHPVRPTTSPADGPKSKRLAQGQVAGPHTTDVLRF